MEQTEKYLHPEKIAFAIYDVKLINHKSRGNPRYLGGILFDCEICSTIRGSNPHCHHTAAYTFPPLVGNIFLPRFLARKQNILCNFPFSSDSPSLC